MNAVSPPAAPNAAPYCTANIQPGVTWGNGDGTYSGIMNVVSVLLICGLLSEPTPANASGMALAQGFEDSCVAASQFGADKQASPPMFKMLGSFERDIMGSTCQHTQE